MSEESADRLLKVSMVFTRVVVTIAGQLTPEQRQRAIAELRKLEGDEADRDLIEQLAGIVGTVDEARR